MGKYYYSELLKTVNNKNGLITYFVKKCDIFTRISKNEYDERYNSAYGISNLYNTTSSNFNRFYTTITLRI